MTTVTPAGPIRPDHIGDQLEGLAAAGAVALDLREVEFLSSEDLGALVALNRRVREGGGHVALVNVRPLAAEVLAVTRLDTLMDVHRGA